MLSRKERLVVALEEQLSQSEGVNTLGCGCRIIILMFGLGIECQVLTIKERFRLLSRSN